MDVAATALAYRRRADAREGERLKRYKALRSLARRTATELHRAFGPDVRVYLFGSLLDLDRFHGESDIDLAVEGLGPAEFWEAWRTVDSIAKGAIVDLVRLETAADSLRACIRTEGEELP